MNHIRESISNDGKNKNQPSEEALRNLIRFLLKTSVPRIIAKRESERKEKEAQNENQSIRVECNVG